MREDEGEEEEEVLQEESRWIAQQLHEESNTIVTAATTSSSRAVIVVMATLPRRLWLAGAWDNGKTRRKLDSKQGGSHCPLGLAEARKV